MYIKIENHDEKNARVIDYPGSISLFIKIHFDAWGFYQVIKAGADRYNIIDKFSGIHVHTISKAKKGDITQ